MKHRIPLFIFACVSIIAVAYIGFGRFFHNAPDIIVEKKNIDSIFEYINPHEYNKKTLVIFDIDNTIAAPPTSLGSDQWFYALHNKFVADGMTSNEAINTILPLFYQIQNHIWLEPIEHNTIETIHMLQEKGVTVIALTARSLGITYRTLHQMRHLGIQFSKTNPYECPISYGDDDPALYIEGIIFSGNYNKGEVLVQWLNQINFHPKKVIFIDDKYKNLHAVEKALHRRDYPFVGIHYTQCDERVKSFNMEQADKELAQFLEEHPESKPLTHLPAHP